MLVNLGDNYTAVSTAVSDFNKQAKAYQQELEDAKDANGNVPLEDIKLFNERMTDLDAKAVDVDVVPIELKAVKEQHAPGYPLGLFFIYCNQMINR